MNCQDFESRVNHLLDQRKLLFEDARLIEHTTHCEPCRRLMGTYCGVMSAMASTTFGAFPDHVPASAPTVEVVTISPIVASGRRKRFSYPALIVSAACLLGLFVVGKSIQDAIRNNQIRSEVASVEEISAQPSDATAAEHSQTDMVEHSPETDLNHEKLVVAVSAKGTPAEMMEQALDLQGLAKRLYFSSRHVSSPEWLQPVAGTIRPLTDSVYSTFSVLKRTLPTNAVDQESGPPQASLSERLSGVA